MAKKDWISRDKAKTLEVLKPFFLLGYSIKKACEYANIPDATFHYWLEKEPELRTQIKSWQSYPNVIGRKNWVEAMQMGDVDKSVEWLRAKEKDEFSTKIQVEDVTPQRDEEIKKQLLERLANKKKRNGNKRPTTKKRSARAVSRRKRTRKIKP